MQAQVIPVFITFCLFFVHPLSSCMYEGTFVGEVILFLQLTHFWNTIRFLHSFKNQMQLFTFYCDVVQAKAARLPPLAFLNHNRLSLIKLWKFLAVFVVLTLYIVVLNEPKQLN